ncbi:efflux RND transporter periplasmic adaptor subunit [Thermovirga sp.]|uniref:HlyD family secretion protein n=1 Tax=Thermovirga sp. TaxID=2699834 RepID=UPI0025EEDB1D|nr:efflux RND transporter periplasmic adaptor subunit [Thermovirga sp.]MBO8154576.1 efflux RND transporter periplasmic adaptor subunit [Thermovirga sp.]
MHKKKLAFILVILFATASLGFVYLRGKPKEAQDENINVSGNIETTEARIGFKIAGRVIERLVDEGDFVEKGQVIALLDDTDLKHELTLREAELESAQAKLAELESGYRQEEVQAARARLEGAVAELNFQKKELERFKKLFQEQVISKQEFDRIQANYKNAMSKVAEARQKLNLLLAGPRSEEIQQAKAAVERAKALKALAVAKLSYSTLKAPFRGVVLSKSVEPGEYVQPGTPIVTIGKLEKVWLRAYINETDLGKVKLGQKAKVTTDTYPNKFYWGKLAFISSEAEFTPKNIQTEEERVKLVYRIKIDIPNPNNELKPGMPADAEIILNEGN